MMKNTKYSRECWRHNSSNLARVPALVHNPRPPQVAHDAVGEPALDTDGVHALVELADPLPSADPAVLRLARRNHPLEVRNSYQNLYFLLSQTQRYSKCHKIIALQISIVSLCFKSFKNYFQKC